MRAPWFSRLGPVAQVCLGAVLVIPVAYLPMISNAHALPKTLILQGLAMILFFILLLTTLSGTTPLERRTFNVFLLLFAGAVIAGAAFSTNRELSLIGSYRRYEGLATWLSYIVIYVGAARFMTDKTVIARVLEGLIWVSAFISIVAILEILTAPTRTYRVHGTFGNPTFLGSFLAMTIPLAIVALRSDANRTRIIGALASGTGLIALYLSFTRSAWLAVLFVVPLAFFVGFKGSRSSRLRLPAIAIAIAAFMIIAAVLIVPGKLSNSYGLARLESATDLTAGTTGTRLEMWRGAAALIRERPIFGWGPETFRDNFPGSEKLSALESVFRRADRPHNHFLYLAFALGLGGAAAYYLFAAGLIWAAATSKAARSAQTRPLVWGMVAALIGYQIQVEFLFSSVEASPVWWLIAGLLAGSLRDSQGKEREPTAEDKKPIGGRRPSAVPAIVIFWLGIAALAAFLFWGGRLLYADYHFKQGLPARETGAPDGISKLERAVEANPSARIYRLALGHAYLANGKATDDRAMVDRSIAVYQEAIDERGDDEFYYSLGDAQAFYGLRWDRGRLTPALEAYNRAAELRPYFPYTYWEIGYIYAQTGAFTRAVPFYVRSLELDPGNADAWSDLGTAYEQSGQTDRAKESYKRALEGQPQLQSAIDGLNRLR